MFLTLLPMLLSWIPGGLLKPILGHIEKKADSANEKLRIELQEEIKRREAQRDVLIAETEHWIAWLPRFLIGMSVALYIAGIFLVSTFQIQWVVLQVPAEMEAVMSVVVGGLFLERTAKILKR